MKHTVRNWAEYDAALRARGSLTLWVTAEALGHWAALPRSTPGQIVASMLTEQDVDDPSQVGLLLDQIEQEIVQVTADGAHDGEPTYETIAQRDSLTDVVIPPRVTAQPARDLKQSHADGTRTCC